MARKKTSYSFQRSGTTPSKRVERVQGQRDGEKPPRSFQVPMEKPKGMSEIAAYVEGEREHVQEDEKTVDLIREFQDEVCKHSQWVEIANGPSAQIMKCTNCATTKRVEKK